MIDLQGREPHTLREGELLWTCYGNQWYPGIVLQKDTHESSILYGQGWRLIIWLPGWGPRIFLLPDDPQHRGPYTGRAIVGDAFLEG